MNRTLYLVELIEPTNTGNYIFPKIYEDKKAALADAKELAEALNDEEDYGDCALEDAGPNWKYVFRSGCVTVKKIDNEYIFGEE